MMTFFSSCLNFLRQKRLVSLFVILGIVMTGVCFGAGTDTPQYTETEMTQGIIEILDLIFAMIALVLGPMVVLAGWLLSPDWTMGDFFGLRPYFLAVWILVSNIVYIIFALMLLYMAIMQIFGGAENEYAFKKKLGPFLVGILIVPFTWLIVSWTLSFANLAVAAVLSIPMNSIGKLSTGTLPGTQNKSLWHAKVLPKEFDFSPNSSGYGEDLKCTGGQTGKGVKCISPAEFLNHNEAGPFFIIMIYAYNIFKIQEADIKPLRNFCKSEDGTQYKAAKDCTKDLMGLIRDFGLSLVVTVFFAIMLIALCWVLLMRAIKLWIYIMLSPLFGLAFFTGEGLGTTVGEGGESGMGSVGFKAFFKLAMVPVLVSAVLAFGLLFVGVVRDNFHSSVKQATVDQSKLYCTDDAAGFMVTYCITETAGSQGPTYGSRLIIGTDIRGNPRTTTSKINDASSNDALIILNFGDTFSKIIDKAADSSVATGAGVAAGAIGSVDDIFAHLILTMLALVFMFMGVKVAVQYDEVTRAAFEPFKKLGESAGNFVAHSPSYLPLPHPAFSAITSPAGVTGLANMIRRVDEEKQASIGRGMQEIMGDPSIVKTSSNLKSAAGNIEESARAMESASKGYVSLVTGHKEFIDNFKKNAEKISNSTMQATAEDGTTVNVQGMIKAIKNSKPSDISSHLNEYANLFKEMREKGNDTEKSFASYMEVSMRNSGVSTGSGNQQPITINGQTLSSSRTGNILKLKHGEVEHPIDLSKDTPVKLDPTSISEMRRKVQSVVANVGIGSLYPDADSSRIDKGLRSLNIPTEGLSLEQKKNILKSLFGK